MDILYWLNLVASLSRGFPPESLRAAGYIIHYHYFSAVQLAVIEKTVGVNSVSFGMAYSYTQGVLLLVFGFYPLFSEVLRKKWLVALAIALSLFSESNYYQTSIYYISHLFSAPFGYDIGTGLAAAAALQLIRIERADRIAKGQAVVFLLLQFICMGAKAPACVILLGFEGLLCLSWLIRRRHIMRTILFGLTSVALCAVVYAAFMSGTLNSWSKPPAQASTSGAAPASSQEAGFPISWKGTSSYVPVLREWYQDANQKLSVPLKVFLALLLTAKYFFYSHMAVSFLCTMRVLQMLRYRTRVEALQLCWLGISTVAFFMTLFLSMQGYSQAYFMMCASPYAILLALYHPPDVPRARLEFRCFKWMIALMLTCICILDAVVFTSYVFRDALHIITTGKVDKPLSIYSSTMIANTITPLEADGYQWIQENTDEDAILISNAILQENKAPVRKGTVFTRRRFYLESFASSAVGVEERDVRAAQIRRYFQGEPEGYGEMLENGVDYVIYLTRIRDGYDAVKNLECVFENNDIRIYKLA